jgi:hypothetical protein
MVRLYMRDELVFGWKNIGGIRLAARDWPDVRAPHGREQSRTNHTNLSVFYWNGCICPY